VQAATTVSVQIAMRRPTVTSVRRALPPRSLWRPSTEG
jgi:hypothetical protein